MNVSLLIPVKSFRNAKQRLSPLLGVADREILAETMLESLPKLEKTEGAKPAAI